MTLELAFAITTMLAGALGLVWLCIKDRYAVKPYRIPKDEMVSIIETARHIKAKDKSTIRTHPMVDGGAELTYLKAIIEAKNRALVHKDVQLRERKNLGTNRDLTYPPPKRPQ